MPSSDGDIVLLESNILALEERVIDLESESGTSLFVIFLIILDLVLIGLVVYFLIIDWPKKKAGETSKPAEAQKPIGPPQQVFDTPAETQSSSPQSQQPSSGQPPSGQPQPPLPPQQPQSGQPQVPLPPQ